MIQKGNILDFNKRVSQKGFDEVVKEMKELGSDHLDIPALRSAYERFKKKYEETVNKYLKVRVDYPALVRELDPWRDKMISKAIIDSIPEFIALIFSVWTILGSEHFYQDAEDKKLTADNRNELKQPHVAQVLSIFRIFGIGFARFNLGAGEGKPLIVNNLVQILTGEGKSITLATVAIAFAIVGFNARIACYSEYLSERDCEDFQKLFEVLNVTGKIWYNTFNSLCEEQLNRDGDIRQMVLHKVLKNRPPGVKKNLDNRPTVLLIDEVDVFFSDSFFN